MKKVATHYDSLKVARDAPAEVIRAAYRSLAQKYHPDRNTGNAEAERAMTVINDAYSVLSDPVQRRQHDLWIRQMESAGAPAAGGARARRDEDGDLEEDAGGLRRAMPWLAGLAAVGLAVLLWPSGEAKRAPRADAAPAAAAVAARPLVQAVPREPAASATVLPGHRRPLAAPNGRDWPRYADYVGGYPRLQDDGVSVVGVDNSAGDTDVFVKLVALDGLKAIPVRWAYVPARGSLAMENVTAGDYDVRLYDLETGRHFRSEAFKLEEAPADRGTRATKLTVSLSAPRSGARAYDLPESEF